MNSSVPPPRSSPVLAGPWGVAAAYVVFGVVWIVGSDWLVFSLLGDTNVLRRVGMAKGLLFVALSAALIYVLVWRLQRAHKRTQRELRASDARHRALIAGVPDLIFRVSREGEYLDVHAPIQDELAIPASDLIGRNILHAVSPELGRQWYATIERTLATREMQQIEYTLTTLRGRVEHFEARSTPLGEDEVLFVARNITERVEAEKARRASEERLRLALDATGVGIWELDVESERVAWSPNMEAIVGLEPGSFGGTLAEAMRYVHPDDQERLGASVALVKEGEAFRTEYRIVRPSGEVAWMAARAQVDETSETRRLVGTVIDITQRREYEQGLVDAKVRAEEMNRLKTAFLAAMSHEIRTPLTAIIGFTELLVDDVDPENQKHLAVVHRAAQRLMETLGSVLDLAQLEGQALELQPEPLDMAREIRQALDLVRARAEGNDVALSFACEPGVSTDARLDAVAFRRVLANLLSNAVKFTDAGRISARLGGDETHAIVEVTDTGIGIEPHHLEDVFDEFTQASGGLARTHEGSGLGLAITRKLVGMMGGTIEVESQPGEGSTFRVRLPRA